MRAFDLRQQEGLVPGFEPCRRIPSSDDVIPGREQSCCGRWLCFGRFAVSAVLTRQAASGFTSCREAIAVETPGCEQEAAANGGFAFRHPPRLRSCLRHYRNKTYGNTTVRCGGFVLRYFTFSGVRSALILPERQPRQPGEPAGSIGPEDPVCATRRWSFIAWPHRVLTDHRLLTTDPSLPTTEFHRPARRGWPFDCVHPNCQRKRGFSPRTGNPLFYRWPKLSPTEPRSRKNLGAVVSSTRGMHQAGVGVGCVELATRHRASSVITAHLFDAPHLLLPSWAPLVRCPRPG